MSNYHLSHDKEKDKWKYQREWADRASWYADTKKEWEKEAKRLSANSWGWEVKIHDKDTGKIIDSDTVKPGNDPRSSKDKIH